MTGAFQKVRVLVLGNVHALLDKAIDLNSVEAIKQNIRDVETALKDIGNVAAIQVADVRTLTRECHELDARAKDLDATITAILSDDDPLNDHLATERQVELETTTAELKGKAEELEAAEKASTELNFAVRSLASSHTQSLGALRGLESMERNAKAKESAAVSLAKAAAIAGAAGSVSVDDVERRLRARKDVADVKLERAMGQFSDVSGKTEATARAEVAIKARKEALALAAAPGHTPLMPKKASVPGSKAATTGKK